MNLFDAYVESLLHFNLNFYLAFSPERGRTVGELVTIISSALARSGVSCTAAEVNQSIENRIAIKDGFVLASHDKIWLNFDSAASAPPTPTAVPRASAPQTSPTPLPPPAGPTAPPLPTSSTLPSPAPMSAMATDHADAHRHGTEVASEGHLATDSLGWEQRIWNTSFARLAAELKPGEVNADKFPIRLLVAAYGKLRNVADDQFKEKYLLGLENVLDNLVPGNMLTRLSPARVVALTNIGETSTKRVMFASVKVIELLALWTVQNET